MLCKTPEPPYYAVIFASVKNISDEGYGEMASRMGELASQCDGFLGIDFARSEIGITVSYWRDTESIRAWKMNSEHLMAQKMGREQWYKSFSLRVAKVERDYFFDQEK